MTYLDYLKILNNKGLDLSNTDDEELMNSYTVAKEILENDGDLKGFILITCGFIQLKNEGFSIEQSQKIIDTIALSNSGYYNDNENINKLKHEVRFGLL